MEVPLLFLIRVASKFALGLNAGAPFIVLCMFGMYMWAPDERAHVPYYIAFCILTSLAKIWYGDIKFNVRKDLLLTATLVLFTSIAELSDT